jgi:uncharacterized protein YxjI
MNYPLQLSFKILALAPQISITDSSGTLIFYVKQKFFALKEAVTVFADQAQTQPIYKIGADRIIDFSARYNFTDMQGVNLGAIKRHGLRSIWNTHFEIFDGEMSVFTIREENPWIKVLDALFQEIPIAGIFSGYVFNPSYIMTRTGGEPVMRLKKQPAFLEGKFEIESLMPLHGDEERRALLGFLMMLLLERTKG